MQNAGMYSPNSVEDAKKQVKLVREMIEQLEDNPEHRSAIEILFKSAERLIAELEAGEIENKNLLDEIDDLNANRIVGRNLDFK
jgi:EAL domain-containing protein (putative c-di-GMP-specific phosphodiesterase class I)